MKTRQKRSAAVAGGLLVWSLSIIFVAVFVWGCSLDSSFGPGVAGSPLSDGTPEAMGVLGFLNDPETTLDVLDHQVPLDLRAARELIAHRDGPDGISGNSDDDLFESVLEVDGVSWVGPTALGRLLDYAQANGWVPTGDDLLGVFDGVPFTVDQARLVLELVNSASRTELDQEIGLDSRAVTSILAARPIPSMDVLSSLYYVGRTALEHLRLSCQPHQSVLELGIISDLDKTVIPPGPERGVLPEAAYPGVAALYNELEFGSAGQAGDTYYVTARTPDGVVDIPDWLVEQALPSGPINPGVSGLPWEARPEKVADMTAVLEANPTQRFVMFGDTNHVDPDVCRDVMELYPQRIVACLLHEVRTCNPERLGPNMFLFDHHAHAAAILFGLGVLDEDAARGIMAAAAAQGLDLDQAQIQDLLDSHRP